MHGTSDTRPLASSFRKGYVSWPISILDRLERAAKASLSMKVFLFRF
jgi:hypothetical protein